MKNISLLLLLPVLGAGMRAQIPVTDVANLVNNELEHIENIAKWAESIAQLKTQITQLNQQISIQGDLRKWTGNPASAALGLNTLGLNELSHAFGKTKDAVLTATASLDSLKNTADGTYRAITTVDLVGQGIRYDDNTFRRYAVLDAKAANAEQVATETANRTRDLQEEVATTLLALQSAGTDAAVQKEAAKLTALNGQLAQVESERRRQIDEVSLQKIANDARIEEERLATAQAEAKDAYLAMQRVGDYMKKLHLRRVAP